MVRCWEAGSDAAVTYERAEPIISMPSASMPGGVLADNVVTVTKGLAQVAGDPTGARVIGARLTGVSFRSVDDPSHRPRVALNGKTLIVYVNPDMGLEGRSSGC